MSIFDVFILSIIEGITEFLPISSTGHLILVSKMLGIKESDFLKSFQIIIQLGAIFAVLFLFWRKFLDVKLLIKLFIAFLPTGICGLFLYHFIKGLFSHPQMVAYMLVIGGILFIILEIFLKNKQTKVNSIEFIDYKKAFFIGCFQALSMIPGTSRSGSTIFGGLILKLDRKVATEFSFLLAVPTMFVASSYDIYKNIEIFSSENVLFMLFGLFLTFVFAIIAIKFLLKFISNFSYIAFGIYRIIIGTIFIVL